MKVKYLLETKNVSDREKKGIEERLGKNLKYLGKYKEGEVFLEIELNQDKRGLLYIEAMIKTPDNIFRSEVHGGDFLVMATEASEELERQIKKVLGKSKDLKKRGARSMKKKMTVNVDARF